MPVLPQFSPQGSPTSAIDSFIEGVDKRQSWMDQAARREQLQQQTEQQRQLFELQRPVALAQHKAQLAQLGNDLTAQTQMNDLLTQANSEMPDIRSRWLDTNNINDPAKRLAAQEQVLGTADKYASLKGVGDEIKQWHDVWAQGVVNQRSREMMTGKNEIAQLTTQSQQVIAQLKAENEAQIARLERQAAEKLAETRRQHEKEMADIRAKSRVASASDIARNTGAYKVNNDAMAAGSQAMKDSVNLQRGLELLKDPELRTGTGANLEVKAKRLAAALGFDASGVSSAEQLQQIMGDSVLARVQQTKGSISDREMALFDQYSASMGKTAEGNAKILEALLRVKQRDVQIAQMVNTLRKQGEDEFNIQIARDDYILSHPIWDGLTPQNQSGNSTPASSWTPEKEKELNDLRAKLNPNATNPR